MKTVGRTSIIQHLGRVLNLSLILVFLLSCEKENLNFEENSADLVEEVNAKAKKNKHSDVYQFPGPVYDIAAAPDGSILVGLNEDLDPNFEKKGTLKVQQIKNGKISTMAEFRSYTALQGIAPIGTGNAFVTTGGADLAEHGELYRVSNGNVRMVADLGAYEFENDPDANAGTQWKKQACEATDGFSAGPQNNPFNVVALTGGKTLVADAAGNTILSATTSGEIDWMAIFTPPVDDNGDYIVRWSTEENGETIPCYVQPVPTSIVEGPDGYVYVGELTGTLSLEDGLVPTELSRVWKIPADANNVVCEVDSGPCELLIDGLTSVIDLAIGPDGLLYVVEFDENSWWSSFYPPVPPAGGTISSYELDGTPVEIVASGLSFPSAISFDKNGNLWLLENNAIALEGYVPTLRMLEY